MIDRVIATPPWLRRYDQLQPFVVTLCATGPLDDSLVAVKQALTEVSIDELIKYGDRACDLFIECKPEFAWSLLQTLAEQLPATDVYLQPLDTPARRLLICDMDMTIVAAETLDEVAAKLGMGDSIAAITARAMHGEIDFNAALEERIAMLAGQSEQVFHEVAAELQLTPGAEDLLGAARAAGLHCILISGGFAQVAEPVAARLGFDEVYCNHLEIESGKLTGKVVGPIINADLKCKLLQQRAQALGITLRDCCAIGDGANDLPMLTAAGLGIAYHPKPVLRAATSCHIDFTDLASATRFMRLASA